jgi:hypothetical protein
MKKLFMFTAVASLCLFFIASAAQAQFQLNRAEEAPQLVAGGKLMVAYGNKLAAAKNVDRATLVDQGYIMLKQSRHYMDQGEMEMGFSDEASNWLQQLGRQFMDSGNVLIKMGRKQGPLTQQEKDETAKQAKLLQKIGNLILKQGQDWGG